MGVKILAHEGSRINDLVITLQLGVNSPSDVSLLSRVPHSIYLAILEAVKYLKMGL